VAGERSSTRAGFAVFGAVAALSSAVWAWTALERRSMVPYVVHFTADDGVYGLKLGGEVLVGGMPLGTVERIEPVTVNGSVNGYQVHILLEREVPLYRGARVGRTDGSISGETQIEVRDVGLRRIMHGAKPMSRGMDEERLSPGSVIEASPPEPFRSTFGGQSSPKLRRLLEVWAPEGDAPGLMADYQRLGRDLPAQAAPVREAFTALRDSIKADWPAWRDRITDARARADAALAKLGMGTDADPSAIMPQARAIGKELESLPPLGIDRASGVEDAFAQSMESIGHMRRVGGDLGDQLTGAAGSLGRFAADFSIAGQELAATEREAFTSPWNLLATPGSAQRAAEARIELARIYAESAVEWRHAMKAIEDALRRDEVLLRTEPALAELLRARMNAATALFQSRSEAMAELLIGP
jgi:hypothetical protein